MVAASSRDSERESEPESRLSARKGVRRLRGSPVSVEVSETESPQRPSLQENDPLGEGWHILALGRALISTRYGGPRSCYAFVSRMNLKALLISAIALVSPGMASCAAGATATSAAPKDGSAVNQGSDAAESDSRVAGEAATAGVLTCHATSDCRAGQVCAWPGVSLGCPGSRACDLRGADGAALDPKGIPGCLGDTECAEAGAGSICVAPDPCSCYVNPICVVGCANSAQCDAGEICSAHRCVATPCQTAGDCPNNFVCSGSCARKTCTTDANCNGYCLGGACYDQIGHCTYPLL